MNIFDNLKVYNNPKNKPKITPNITKQQFIKEMLEFAANNKVDIELRNKVIGLVNEEMKNTESITDFTKEILERLKSIEGVFKSFTSREINEHSINDDNNLDIISEIGDDFFDIDSIPEKNFFATDEENQFNDDENKNVEEKITSKTKIFPKPKDVADFMSLFNQRDGLKYLTHDYDMNNVFEIDKFLISANDVFIKKTQEINIPQSLWRIVKQFAFDSKQTKWSSVSEDYKKPISITIGWATKELRDWSKKNHLHPIHNEKYKIIINNFRRITRIETGNLDKLIDTTLESVFEMDIENFVIEKKDLSKADFYTHVGFLKNAFEIIFEEIRKRSDSPEKKKISIKLERSHSDDGYFLRRILISHLNSYPNKELNLILKEWFEKGNMGKIKEKLEGYCYWSVETLIEDIPTKINILRDIGVPTHEIIESIPGGFTHILTFYYK